LISRARDEAENAGQPLRRPPLNLHVEVVLLKGQQISPGQRFGELEVMVEAPEKLWNEAAYICRCSCGETTALGAHTAHACGSDSRPKSTRGTVSQPVYRKI